MTIAYYIRNDKICAQVKSVLTYAGLTSERFLSEVAFLRASRRRDFELILVDIAAEKENNKSIVSWLNCRSGDKTPVVALSMINNPDMIAFALDSGADDFVASPFESIELHARIHALLRRCNRRSTSNSIELNGFALNRELKSVSFRGEPIELTPHQFSLAWLFFSSPGIYISRETIVSAVWGIDSETSGRTIEQNIYKLRKKMELGPERGVIIRTAYSQGYRIELCA